MRVVDGKLLSNLYGTRAIDFDAEVVALDTVEPLSRESLVYNRVMPGSFVYPVDHYASRHATTVLAAAKLRTSTHLGGNVHGERLVAHWMALRHAPPFAPAPGILSDTPRTGRVLFVSSAKWPPEPYKVPRVTATQASLKSRYAALVAQRNTLGVWGFALHETALLNAHYRRSVARRDTPVFHWMDSKTAVRQCLTLETGQALCTAQWLDCHLNPFWNWTGAATVDGVRVRLEIVVPAAARVAITSRYDAHWWGLNPDNGVRTHRVPPAHEREQEIRLPPGCFTKQSATTSNYFGNGDVILSMLYEPH